MLCLGTRVGAQVPLAKREEILPNDEVSVLLRLSLGIATQVRAIHGQKDPNLTYSEASRQSASRWSTITLCARGT